MKTYSDTLSLVLIVIGVVAIIAGVVIRNPAIKSALIAYLALP